MYLFSYILPLCKDAVLLFRAAEFFDIHANPLFLLSFGTLSAMEVHLDPSLVTFS